MSFNQENKRTRSVFRKIILAARGKGDLRRAYWKQVMRKYQIWAVPDTGHQMEQVSQDSLVAG
jgi:hypothetical protein